MPQQQAEHTTVARGQRKPPRGREVGSRAFLRHFDDDSCERAAFQPFFHGPERIDGTRNAHNNHSFKRKTKESETGAIKLAGFMTGEIRLNP